MRAIVCDKCGKTILVPDGKTSYDAENGVFYLVSNAAEVKLDLCEECANELLTLVRKENM